jgi:MoaA/NifB/PqqE/SkfB family radical SAM enzyme
MALALFRGPQRDQFYRRMTSPFIDCVPVYVVWEITLACNLKSVHCGSRAGHRRAKELSTGECIDVVRQLAELGTRENSIIGGEAFVRKDWLTLVRAIRDHGMDCTMQTGGYKLSRQMIEAAAEAGLLGLRVSLDGLQQLHDRLRGVPAPTSQRCACWPIAGTSA